MSIIIHYIDINFEKTVKYSYRLLCTTTEALRKFPFQKECNTDFLTGFFNPTFLIIRLYLLS